jgi:hypothetical protein
MSSRRTKQYLMLLMVIGLVSVAAGGVGTFASFDAEVTNSGNYFANGSLVLNDDGGTNTCTSAAAADNHFNTSTNCDTFFTLSTLSSPKATTTGATVTNASTSISFSGLTGSAIDAGDTLTLSNGSTTDTVTASSGADVGATSVNIDASGLAAHTYAAGSTLTDAAGTFYAKLTLTNAGSLDASGIKFKQSTCTSAAQEGTGALTTSVVAGTYYTTLAVSGGVSGTFADGDPVVITDGTHSQTFIANGAVANCATSITVHDQAANANYSNANTTISGPSFGAGDLCSALTLSIVETDASFDHDGTNNAAGCAYGTNDTNNATDGLGCALSGGTALGSVPSSLTALTLASGFSSNTGTQLDHSQSRYFLVAVKNTNAFTNTYQNRKATFDLTWHIDQA